MLLLRPLQEPRRVKSRFIGIWKVRIYFLLYHFWIKTRSSAPFLTTHTPNNLYCITKHENDVQSPVKTYPIIALHEHEAIFHVLELYSTDQILFFRIRDRSITCAFLTNNLHSIPYSNSITRTKLTFSYPIVCSFLVNNVHFITYFTHRGQSPDRQKPIEEPSLKYYSFLLLSVSSLIQEHNISLARVYWRYHSFSLRFAVKLCGIIFLRRLTVDEWFILAVHSIP